MSRSNAVIVLRFEVGSEGTRSTFIHGILQSHHPYTYVKGKLWPCRLRCDVAAFAGSCASVEREVGHQQVIQPLVITAEWPPFFRGLN